MSSDLETLGRRAVACRHWRWMAGMHLIHPAETDGMTGYALRLAVDGYKQARLGEYPDLSDPATVGCLAALVRQVSGKPHLFAQFTLDDHWSICDLHDHRSAFVRSEAEAWVEVLEEVQP
jgi:hypothetical protein